MTAIKWRDEFDSLGALLARQAAPCTTEYDDSRDTSPSRWNGNVTLAGACDLARLGWPQGREDWSAHAVADFSGYAVPAPVVTYDVAGAFPDIPRAVAGDPACFADRGVDADHKPIVTVVVNIAASAATPTAAIRNRGLALLTAIDNAEARGARVELLGAFAARDYSNNAIYAASWPIKPADQPLDLDRLAFSLAHPAMLRRIVFRALETHSGRPLAVFGAGYGIPCDHKSLAPAGAVYLPCLLLGEEKHYLTPDKAFGYVSQLITKAIEVQWR